MVKIIEIMSWHRSMDDILSDGDRYDTDMIVCVYQAQPC